MTIVYVWKKSDKTEMGHASMMITAGDAAQKRYVSWYPKSKGAGDAFVFEVEFCSEGKAYKSLKEEMEAEWGGKKPDLAVSLNGLNEVKMKADWERLKTEGQWCLAGKNCATVVYILLRAGGAPKEESLHDIDKIEWAEEDHLGSKMARMTKNAWTPIRVYNYANAVSRSAMKK